MPLSPYLIGLSLSGLLLACSVVPNLSNSTLTEAPVTATAQEILGELAIARVVYLAEIHDSEADHAAQLEIIQALADQGSVAIGLEMFQRPFQPVLDAYLAGSISEAELVTQSEYDTRWGFPWEFYAPIVRYAKANQIPLIALNAPAEVTRKVARSGLESLTPDDLRNIPPLSDIDTTDGDYRTFFADITGVSPTGEAHSSAHGGLDFENFFAAQVLWDETMAAAIADFAQANPDTQVIVLAGQGHILYDYGIPNRVERRLGSDLVQRSVILSPSDTLRAEGAGIAGDFFWP